MIEVKAYKADCGRRFAAKKSCLLHEKVCSCWTNPKHKTCKTCKFGKNVYDNNGMQDEPQLLHTWRQWQCSNPAFNYDLHFTPAHANAADLCINCPVYVNKTKTNKK